ncbi:MAG: hypothetical protein EOM67_02270 [Spirochaetia bacterium]|nr:hypothetical protein [Spirochaetia bacterium]
MKKKMLLILLATVLLLAGCMTSEKNNEEAYNFLIANIDDNDAIKTFLHKEIAGGYEIDDTIMAGDTVLMLAARFTTNIEVLKTIASYYPSIHQLNRNNDMSALDYLSRREGTKEMIDFLIEESVKQELTKKVNETKTNVVKSIFKKF